MSRIVFSGWVLIIALIVSATSFAQSSQVQLINNLTTPKFDEFPNERLQDAQQLLLAGNSLEPGLISAFNAGPASSDAAGVGSHALYEITKLQSWLQSKGTSTGLDTATIANVLAISPAQYASQSQAAYVQRFQENALLALGPIAGPTGKALLAQLAQNPSSPFQSVAKQVLGNTFAAFSASFIAKGGLFANFELEGSIGLASGSTINPVATACVIRIGSFVTTVPANSFRAHTGGTYTFEGKTTSSSGATISLEVSIKPKTTASPSAPAYTVEIEGAGVDLSALTKPVEVGLQLGNLSGTTQARSN